MHIQTLAWAKKEHEPLPYNPSFQDFAFWTAQIFGIFSMSLPTCPWAQTSLRDDFDSIPNLRWQGSQGRKNMGSWNWEAGEPPAVDTGSRTSGFAFKSWICHWETWAISCFTVSVSWNGNNCLWVSVKTIKFYPSPGCAHKAAMMTLMTATQGPSCKVGQLGTWGLGPEGLSHILPPSLHSCGTSGRWCASVSNLSLGTELISMSWIGYF
jgi:hypothetical protein